MYFLVADDSAAIRNLIALWFSVAHHTVRFAINGQQAVAAVEEESFDAILLDLHMPFMNGWEALQHIRELPNGKVVPIAVFSDVYDRANMEPSIALGADAIFSKPFEPGVFIAAVEEMVVRSRKKQDL